MKRFLMAMMLAVTVAGCGLGDYEKRMEDERVRIKVFDDEVRLLDDAATQPFEKSPKAEEGDRPVWPFDVFLRLPVGVSSTVVGQFHGPAYTTLNLYQYAGREGFNVFIAAALLGEKQKGEGKTETADDFRLKVKAALKAYYSKTHNGYLVNRLVQEQPVKDVREPKSWRGETLPPLEFEKFTGNDEENRGLAPKFSNFELYINRQANRQVAILYQIPQEKAIDKQTMDAIDLSLKSLDISDQVAAKRAELQSLLARVQGRR